MIKSGIKRLINHSASAVMGAKLRRALRPTIERLWKACDRECIRPEIVHLIDRTPPVIWGGVGGDSYTSWIFQQGIFSVLIKSLSNRESLRILDMGCGLGKIAAISVPLTYPNGEYIGIDIRHECIAYCQSHYRNLPRVRFAASNDWNSTYSDPSFHPVPGNSGHMKPTRLVDSACGGDWPVEDGSMDIVIAVSVFTHLRESDAQAYLTKIHSVLRPGGFAILTILLMEPPGFAEMNEYTTALPPSENFFTATPNRPEDTIALNETALKSLCAGRFSIFTILRSNYVDSNALLPQDIVVFRKD